MEKIKTITPTRTIEIGDKEYDVAIAETPEERTSGLEPYAYLRPDEGMLFIFEEPTTSPFTMANTSINLDIVFMDEYGEVMQVTTAKAFDKEPITCHWPYNYVLEVRANSSIQEGDEMDWDDDDPAKMLVLNSQGDVQMKLVGGERILSMIKTRQLIKAALKAYKEETDTAYRRVGKIVITELDAQDSRPASYVEKE